MENVPHFVEYVSAKDIDALLEKKKSILWVIPKLSTSELQGTSHILLR